MFFHCSVVPASVIGRLATVSLWHAPIYFISYFLYISKIKILALPLFLVPHDVPGSFYIFVYSVCLHISHFSKKRWFLLLENYIFKIMHYCLGVISSPHWNFVYRFVTFILTSMCQPFLHQQIIHVEFQSI